MDNASPLPYTEKSFLNLQKYIEAQTGAHACYMPDENRVLFGRAEAPDSLSADIFKKAEKSGRPVMQQSDGGWAAGIPVLIDKSLAGVWFIDGLLMSPSNSTNTSKPVFHKDTWQIFSQSLLFLTVEILTTLQEAKMPSTGKMPDIPSHEDIKQELARGIYHYLMVLDIEGLRKTTDVSSQRYGDLLLKNIYDYIKQAVMPGAKVYRLDMAYFGILLKRENEEEALLLAKKIQDRCNHPWPVAAEGCTPNLYITVNICILPGDIKITDVGQNLLSAVAHTLDIARKNGGIALFDDKENTAFSSRMRMELSLNHSLQDNMAGFSVVYQPIVDPGIAMWTGFEALCRWHSPDFGDVSPVEFIPIAEAAGFIHTIGTWVLEEGLRQIKQCGLDSIKNFVLNVNLSTVQLTDPALVQTILDLLHRYDYPPEKLCLEITKSNDLNFSAQAIHIIQRLNDMGILIALDDFGAGYTSLNNINKLPVKLVKTDRALINNIENDTFLQRLFYVMAEIAHASNIKIVAEGVENESQAQLLLKNGADFFQGYQFSYPLTAQEIEAHLANFQNPVAHIISLGYNRLDLSRLSDEHGGYELPPPLYKLLSRCMQVLFSAEDGNKAIDTALAYIGDGLKVSRSYVFLKNPDGTYTNTHEWCAKGIAPEKDNLIGVDIAGISPEWVGTLSRDGMLVASNIDQLNRDTFDVLIQQGIKAVVEFPIMEDGVLHGFAGFDDCEDFHYWTSEEIQMLHTLTNIIAATLRRMRLQEGIATQSDCMKNMLDNMDAFIYVSDLETNEILFANSSMQENYADRPLIGAVCWEALQGNSARCSFCPVPYLLEHPGESYQWEFYNHRAKAHFKISDSIIPWEDGKMVHFEYAVNITKLKQYQIQLEEYATTDMLTHALNRGHFIQQGEYSLMEALRNGREVTLAFIDIDGLKMENDLKGHIAGDRLIQAVVNALRDNIRHNDTIGRYGGDEFLILFFDCNPKDAERRINIAQNTLGQHKDSENYSFSYGLASNNEEEFSGAENCLAELIHAADQRMIANKRSKKDRRPSRP